MSKMNVKEKNIEYMEGLANNIYNTIKEVLIYCEENNVSLMHRKFDKNDVLRIAYDNLYPKMFDDNTSKEDLYAINKILINIDKAEEDFKQLRKHVAMYKIDEDKIISKAKDRRYANLFGKEQLKDILISESQKSKQDQINSVKGIIYSAYNNAYPETTDEERIFIKLMIDKLSTFDTIFVPVKEHHVAIREEDVKNIVKQLKKDIEHMNTIFEPDTTKDNKTEEEILKETSERLIYIGRNLYVPEIDDKLEADTKINEAADDNKASSVIEPEITDITNPNFNVKMVKLIDSKKFHKINDILDFYLDEAIVIMPSSFGSFSKILEIMTKLYPDSFQYRIDRYDFEEITCMNNMYPIVSNNISYDLIDYIKRLSGINQKQTYIDKITKKSYVILDILRGINAAGYSDAYILMKEINSEVDYKYTGISYEDFKNRFISCIVSTPNGTKNIENYMKAFYN